MSYGRMADRAAELEAEVAGWLSTAAAADAEEDKLYGRDKSGEEIPDWVADKQRRIEKIRAAEAELGAEAKAAAETKRKAEDEAASKRGAEPKDQSPWRVGRCDTVVVDTIGPSDDTYIDNYRAPQTTQLHVVEHFKVTNGRKTLEVTIQVDDPGAFNMPWSARQIFTGGLDVEGNNELTDCASLRAPQ